MNPESFMNLLDRHGARPERWPPPVRAEMESFLRQSASAREAFDALQELEEGLRQLEHTVTPGLEARIMALAGQARSPGMAPPSLPDRFLEWLTGALWRPALLSLAPLLLGAVLGMNIDPGEDASMNMTGLLLDEVYANHE